MLRGRFGPCLVDFGRLLLLLLKVVLLLLLLLLRLTQQPR